MDSTEESFHSPISESPESIPASPSISPLSPADPSKNAPAPLAELLSKGQSDMLHIIHLLRSRGIDSYIDLPRVVVCGKTSCGKSSVLEAISHVSFPRNERLCTQFATELTLNDLHEQGVWIAWAGPLPAGCAARTRIGDGALEDMEKVVGVAAKRMQRERGIQSFYQDVLEVKVRREGWPSLTMVDLPGLIGAAPPGGKAEDVETVSRLVDGYLMKKETIILAILAAEDTAPNQGILEKVIKYDPLGMRTMGIITRLDKIKEGGSAEEEWVSYANNQQSRYNFGNLGWHMMRNRDDGDHCTFERRDQDEEVFFDGRSVWREHVEEGRTGVKQLRLKLATILEKRIRESLPKIGNTLVDLLSQKMDARERLGVPRQGEMEQEAYIQKISSDFHHLVQQASSGNYGGPERNFFEKPEAKLSALVRKLDLQYVDQMLNFGHKYSVEEVTDVHGRETAECGITKLPTTNQAYCEHLREIILENGRPGLPIEWDVRLVTRAFQEQAENWRPISEYHISKVMATVQEFLSAAVDHTAKDAHTAQKIKALVIQPGLEQINAKVFEKLDEILLTTENLDAITYDPHFLHSWHAQLTEIEKDRAEKSRFGQPVPPPYEFAPNMKMLVEIYYTGAITRFIDNVAIFVIQATYMAQLNQLFTPMSMTAMRASNPDAFADLASEVAETVVKRHALDWEIEKLNESVSQLKSFGVLISPLPPRRANVRASHSFQRPRSTVTSPLPRTTHSSTGSRSGPVTPQRMPEPDVRIGMESSPLSPSGEMMQKASLGKSASSSNPKQFSFEPTTKKFLGATGQVRRPKYDFASVAA